jgi:hypothetical protein
MFFVFILKFNSRFIGCRRSNRPAAGYEADENHDDGDHEEDVDEPANGGASHQAEQPQDEQYYRDCVQHIIFRFFRLLLPGARYDLGRLFAMGCNPTVPCGRRFFKA